MKRFVACISLISVVLLTTVALPSPVEARFPGGGTSEFYYGKGFWQYEMNYAHGIRGGNYVYQQNPGSGLLFSQFVAAPGWEWDWGCWTPSGWYTAGYYQLSTSSPRFIVTWKHGAYSYECWDVWEYAPLETHRDYEIYNNWGTWYIYIDGVQRKTDTYYGGGGSFCCMVSKRVPSGQCYGWFEDLQYCTYSTDWDDWYSLGLADTVYVGTYRVNDHCFGTYAN